MVQQFDAWIAQVGPEAFLFLGLASMLEYVFPPFPGDTLLILGGVYAIRGQKPWGWVFLSVTLGSLVGAAVDYWIGTRLSRHVETRPEETSFLGLSHAKIRELQAKMRRLGPMLIAVNRFLPGVRSLLFVAAGAARMPFTRVMLLGAISSAAWNLLLLAVGIALGGSAERVEHLLRQYYLAGYALLAAIGLFAVVRVLRKRKTG